MSSKREKDPAGCGHWIQDWLGPGGPFFVIESSLSLLTESPIGWGLISPMIRPGHRRSLGAKCLEAEQIDERKRFNG